jgi:hypothetical protein
MAAVLFAAVQKPHEAIMWLAAMPYALGGFCALVSLLLWQKGRCVASTTIFLLGLFSTESLLVLILLVPLTDAWASGRLRWRHQYVLLLGPPAFFAIVFILTLPVHHMVNERTYAMGWHAAAVLGRSLFRLVFPTLLVAFLLLSFMARCLFFRQIAWGMAWMALTLLPFIFLTYQGHVPSRHNYLPAMGLAMALAGLLAAARHRRLASAIVAIFAVANVAYIWTRKDAQFELRARPTTQLLRELEGRAPEPIRVMDFPLNPWMAKAAARHVPGWDPKLIRAGVPGELACSCPGLRWNDRTGRYDSIPHQDPDARPDRFLPVNHRPDRTLRIRPSAGEFRTRRAAGCRTSSQSRGTPNDSTARR